MMQYIELNEMAFYGYHGVTNQEKIVGNIYIVDLKIYFDFQEAMQSDNLKDTINYASIYEIVKQEMNISANLIEHLTYRIASKIKQRFHQISELEIRLAKRNPPISGDMKEAAVVLKL
ncbi:MAG: dihydroneopterin aldolase [Dysgonamonadaceae bacterium]|jgi:dihydroneopterin aldolase|nr:dihydroneopterin aldolase [Dysgonamonadaceae bacterium]